MSEIPTMTNILDSLTKEKQITEARLADARIACNQAESQLNAAKASPNAAAELSQAEQAVAQASNAEWAVQADIQGIAKTIEQAVSLDDGLRQQQSLAQAFAEAAQASQYQAAQTLAGAAARVRYASNPVEMDLAQGELARAAQTQASTVTQLQSATQNQQAVVEQQALAGVTVQPAMTMPPAETLSPIRQTESLYFLNTPANTLETRNAQSVLEAITQESEDCQQQAKAADIVQTAQQLDNRSVYIGELQPGDKLYAFATAANSADAGYKSEQSYYYTTEKQLQTMVDHGLIDFEQKTIHRQGIGDYLGLPQGNAATCLVEAAATTRTGYIETRVGAAESARETEFITGETYAESVQRAGGGYQVHPDLDALSQSRAEPNTLPIATFNGQSCDFRGYAENHSEFGPAQSAALAADYAQRRSSEFAQTHDNHMEAAPLQTQGQSSELNVSAEMTEAQERKEALRQWQAMSAQAQRSDYTQGQALDDVREYGRER